MFLPHCTAVSSLLHFTSVFSSLQNQHTNHRQIGGHKYTCPAKPPLSIPLSYLSIRVTLLHILESLGQRCIRKCYLYFEVQLQYKSACFLLLLLFLFIYTRNLFVRETEIGYLVSQSLNHEFLGHSLSWEK